MQPKYSIDIAGVIKVVGLNGEKDTGIPVSLIVHVRSLPEVDALIR